MRLSLRLYGLLLIIGCGILLTAGCAQKDDIARPQDKTTIILRPTNLPEMDSLYIYELWVVQMDGNDSIFTSLGRFLWDQEFSLFRDTAWNKIDSSYELPETWLTYDYIMVSIENRDDTDPEPSGTFMLVEDVFDPSSDVPKMEFPISMFEALGLYFVGSPTDDYSYYSFDTLGAPVGMVRVSDNEGRGLWLCSRSETERSNWDTLGIDSMSVTVVNDSADTEGWLLPDTVGIYFPDDTIYVVESTFVVFGYDTFPHRRINIDWHVLQDDSVDSFFDYILRVGYQIDSIAVDSLFPLGDIDYFDYSGPMEYLPDIKPYGWRYNAWVFIEQPEIGPNSGLNLPIMAAFGYDRQYDFTGETSWGVLPLGGFYRADSADLSNKFNDSLEVPQFPGSDFVNDDAAGLFDNLDLRRDTDTDWGTIVVGMEPDPDNTNLIVDTTRNFPLFVLSDKLRSATASDVNSVHTFHNYSQYLPSIRLVVTFHE